MSYTTNAKLAIIMFVTGLVLDSVSTSLLIKHPQLSELNPVMLYANSTAGLLGLVAIKLVMTGLLLLLLHLLIPEERQSQMMAYAGIVVGGIWMGAGVWNLFIHSTL